MAITLTLAGGGKTVDLYPFMKPELRSGTEALAGIEGFGLPPVTPRWFQGAGGSTFRGSRNERRPVAIPLYVFAADRSELNARVDDLGTVLDASYGECVLTIGTDDQEEWYLRLVRTGGGDWKRKQDSDDRKFFKTTITFEAGQPYWERVRPEQFTIEPNDQGQTLLPFFARLQLGSGTAFGTRTVSNPGNTLAWPFWTIDGPTTQLEFIGAEGESLLWEDTLAAGEHLYVDTRKGLVYDDRGPVDGNRYAALAAAPRFWPLKPGQSIVSVAARDASSGAFSAGQELRRNLTPDPQARGLGTIQSGKTGWIGRWFGNGGAGTASVRQGQTDGPLPEVTSYVRKLWSTIGSNVSDVGWSHTLQQGVASGVLNALPVAPGSAISFSSYVRPSRNQTAADPSNRMVISAYTADGNFIANYNGPSVSTPLNASTWTRFGHSIIVPANAAYVTAYTQVYLDRATWQAGDYLDGSALLVESAGTVRDFFDGSSPDDSRIVNGWFSAPFASPSIQSTAVVTGRTRVLAQWQPRRQAVI
jgi:hypothetical protein